MSKFPAQQALTLFEESLDLLEQNLDTAFEANTELSTLPFLSLLNQCEAILEVEPADAAPLSFLIAMPGVPALQPQWWDHNFSGLVVREVTNADCHDLGFDAWTKAVCATGTPLLLTAALGVVTPKSIAANVTALVVCHPYRAFCALPVDAAITLEDYCSRLLRALDELPHVQAIKIEDISDLLTSLPTALHLDYPVTKLFVLSEDIIDPAGVPPYFEGGDAYETLCSQLGYDERNLPTEAEHAKYIPTATYQTTVTRGNSPAFISDFLNSAANVRSHLSAATEPYNFSAVVTVLDMCTNAPEEDFYDLFDRATDQLSCIDRTLANLAAAAHFQALGARLSALNFIGNAQLHVPPGESWVNVLIAAAYTELNDASSALMALAYDALKAGVLNQAVGQKLNEIVSKSTNAGGLEHGHILLLNALNRQMPTSIDRQRVLIEIGTTRELVLGQGSTQKLAELCAEYGFMFITVDMDPRNTRNAVRMFAREGLNFLAVNAKGEDFLAQYVGIIDYIFLDAYDFDHGNHSEIRQDRYERFLGSRIEEAQCQQMHLDCAQSILPKMALDGLICIDDTWTTPGGHWAAKGAAAVPFLLENGFKLIEAKNKAALLERDKIT